MAVLRGVAMPEAYEITDGIINAANEARAAGAMDATATGVLVATKDDIEAARTVTAHRTRLPWRGVTALGGTLGVLLNLFKT